MTSACFLSGLIQSSAFLIVLIPMLAELGCEFQSIDLGRTPCMIVRGYPVGRPKNKSRKVI
jgi:hypothetical protein